MSAALTADLGLALVAIAATAALLGAVWLIVVGACVWWISFVLMRPTQGGVAQQRQPGQRPQEAQAGGGEVLSVRGHGVDPVFVAGDAAKHAAPLAATNETGRTVP